MADFKISSLYLHFPFCQHLCNYCDFHKRVPKGPEDIRVFEERLWRSWEIHQKLMQSNGISFSPLDTLYIGGGTPGLWGEKGAQFLKKFLNYTGLSLAPGAEFTIEVNPGSSTKEMVAAFAQVGANRWSVGAQSLDARFLPVLDRVHSLQDVYQTLEIFRDLNLDFSVDFMLGLPYSEEWKREMMKELDDILSFNPKHLSLYILTLKGKYPHPLPNEDYVADEYLMVAEKLKAVGMEHYEVSNFARPGHHSRHNFKYWKHESVAALGPSAVGFLAPANLRYKWNGAIDDFSIEKLTKDEANLEKIFLGLRCSDGHPILDQFPWAYDLVGKWKESGQIWNTEPVQLTSKGFLMVDSLMNELFQKERDFLI